MAFNSIRPFVSAAVLGVATLGLAACGSSGSDERLRADLAASQVTAIGVNAYLWRASLETLSFMPFATADSAGGVLITDWYVNPDSPSERMKVSVAILDQDLRADALRVGASRQVFQNGVWVEAPVAAATIQRLEQIILTEARNIRRASIS